MAIMRTMTPRKTHRSNQGKSPGERFDRLFVTGGGALSDEEPDLIGTRIGPYRIESIIDEGGTSKVYEGSRCDDTFQQTVAIKVLNRNAERFIQRFLQERQHLADLQHAAIARIIDAGKTDDGRPYLVMDRVEGKPIDDFVRATHADLDEIVRLVLQVCRVVAHAHDTGIFHHDIKPGNILVDHQRQPRLLDFGIASVERSASSSTEMLTPRFAAPEQFDGRTEGAATDIFQLGLLISVLIDDAHPMGNDDDLQAVARTTRQIASQWRTRLARLDLRKRELRAILIRCCEPDPADRYACVADLVADLEFWLVGKPVSALPRALRSALAHSARTRPSLWVSAAAVTSMLAAGTWLAIDNWREDQSRNDALTSMLSDVLEAQDDPDDVIVNSSFELAGGALADDPETEKRLTESSARGLLRRGKVHEARKLLISVIGRAGFGFESESNYGNLHALLGDAYLRDSNLAQAEKHLLIARRTAESAETRELAERGLEFVAWAASRPARCEQSAAFRSEWVRAYCESAP